MNHELSLSNVRQIPAQDLFLRIKDTGLNDSLELIELMSTEQLKSCLDFDGWHDHEIRPQAIANWFEAIMSTNPRKATQLFRELDIEFVCLLLKTYSLVYDMSLEEGPAEIAGEFLITPDNHYMVVFHHDVDDHNLIHFIKQAIEQLYERDMAYVLRLIEGVRWETTSLLQEEAWQSRDRRLQDLGFAPSNEAFHILTYVNPGNFQHVDTPTLPHSAPAHSTSILLKNISSESIFSKALSELDAESQLRVKNELLNTSNKVHVALKKDLGDPDELKRTVTYTIGVVETAISFLAKGFNHSSVQHLFQIGHSLALQIGRDFRKIMKNTGLHIDDLKRLDHPLAETVRGVLQPQPLFFAGLSDPRRLDYRQFESLIDISQATTAVAESVFRALLLGSKGMNLIQDTPPELTHGVLLGTAFAHIILDDPPSSLPLSIDELQKLRNQLEVIGEGKRFKSADVKRCEEFAVKLAGSADAQKRAQQYTRVVIGAIENELSRIGDVQIDPRYVSSIRLTS